MATELMPKRLELLSDLVPQAGLIGLLVNPNNASTEPQLRDVQQAAGAKGVRLRVLQASTESEIDAAFLAMAQLRPSAALIPNDGFYSSQRHQIVALAGRQAFPTMYGQREFPAVGGLLSYGISYPAAYRQVGNYAGRILKGEKPADLPVARPTKFELVINLKTAKTLSLQIPDKILALADEVSE